MYILIGFLQPSSSKLLCIDIEEVTKDSPVMKRSTQLTNSCCAAGRDVLFAKEVAGNWDDLLTIIPAALGSHGQRSRG